MGLEWIVSVRDIQKRKRGARGSGEFGGVQGRRSRKKGRGRKGGGRKAGRERREKEGLGPLLVGAGENLGGFRVAEAER